MNIKSLWLALFALVTLSVIRVKAQDAAVSTNSTADAGVADASASAPLVEAETLAQQQAADAAQAVPTAMADAATPVAAPVTAGDAAQASAPVNIAAPAQADAAIPVVNPPAGQPRPAAPVVVLNGGKLPENPYNGDAGVPESDYELKVYGTADIGLVYNSQSGVPKDPKTGQYPKHAKQGVYSVMSGVGNGTFIGFRGRIRPTNEKYRWLEAGLFIEATYNVDTGNGGSATNLNNANDTGAPSCTIAGATGASCNFASNGGAGLVFQREARVRLLFGRSEAAMDQHSAGERDQLSIGRYYTPTLYNTAPFSSNLFGLGSPLTLSGVNQGATGVRASNSLTYISRTFGGGWSVMTALALGERGRLKDGDLFGMRLAYFGKGLHVGLASQFTFHPEKTVATSAGKQYFGNVSVTNLGVSYKLGIFTAAAFVQYTRVCSEKPWNGTFTQLHLNLQATEELSFHATGAWLEVYRSPNNAGQFSAGAKYRFSKLLAANLRWTYVKNQGKAEYRNPGTPAVFDGRDAWSFGAGLELNFP